MKLSLSLFRYTSLLLGVLFVGLFLSSLPGTKNIWFFFNSDTLYLPSIYLDVFVHGSGIQGWHLNAAPNFFPDMLLYMAIMGIVHKTAVATMIFGFVQFALVMILIQYFFKILDPGIKTETLIFINFFLILIISSPVFGEDLLIPYQLLIPAYHCGFFINTLAGFILAGLYLRRKRNIYLVGTAIIIFLAVISDRLFLIGYIFPSLLLMILLFLKRGNSLGEHILLTAVIILSSVTGMLVFKWLGKSDIVYIISTDWKMFQFDRIGESFHNLVKHMSSLFNSAPIQRWMIILMIFYFITAPVYLIYHIRSFLGNSLTTAQSHHYRLVFILLVLSVAVFFIPVINGSYVGPAIIRYNYAGLIMGSLGFIYLLVIHLRGWKWFSPVSSGLIAVVTLTFFILLLNKGIKENMVAGLKEFTRYYPEKSRILDELKEPYELKYGIANYWHAKQATIFSKKNVRVYSVYDANLKPYYHVTNENWFHDGGKGKYADPVFNFIYADAGYNDPAILHKYFGNRLDTIYAKDGAFVIKLPEFKFDRETKEIYLLKED